MSFTIGDQLKAIGDRSQHIRRPPAGGVSLRRSDLGMDALSEVRAWWEVDA